MKDAPNQQQVACHKDATLTCLSECAARRRTKHREKFTCRRAASAEMKALAKTRTPFIRRGERIVYFYVAMCSHCFWNSELHPTWKLARSAAHTHQRDAATKDAAQRLKGINHPFMLYSGSAARMFTKEDRSITR